MAKKFLQNVIGIEINEERVLLSQLDLLNGVPKVSKVKEVSIPPRTIVEGLIADLENFSEQINNALEEGGFASNNIVVSLNSNKFYKRCSVYEPLSEDLLVQKIEDKIRLFHSFLRTPFNMGFQKYEFKNSKDVKKDDGNLLHEQAAKVEKQAVLSAAVSSDLIANIEEVTTTISKIKK